MGQIERIRAIPGVCDVLMQCVGSVMHVRLCEVVDSVHREKSLRGRHERQQRSKISGTEFPQKVYDIMHDMETTFPCERPTVTSTVLGDYMIEAKVHPDASVSYDDAQHFWITCDRETMQFQVKLIPNESGADARLGVFVKWRSAERREVGGAKKRGRVADRGSDRDETRLREE